MIQRAFKEVVKDLCLSALIEKGLVNSEKGL
jgi:hypothetical protein